MRGSRMWLIGRGIVIGLCVTACFVALSLHAERVAAAGYIVNMTSDSGPGSLRDAITQVNTSTDPGNTITFSVTGTITLTSALPAINKPVAITGPTSGTGVTVSGGNAVQVFVVSSGVTASISTLTIANGNANNGGGIANYGTLTVTNSTLSGNSASDGGGIYTNSNGTVTVTNSTVTGNSAVSGGGIYDSNHGTLTVTNSTISRNSGANFGGGIVTSGTLNLTNTIVAGNIAFLSLPPYPSDISGDVTTTGHNLIGNTSGSTGITNGMNGDIVNPMPLLGALASNGGPTQTVALLAGSPAIGAGDPTVCASTSGIAPVSGKDQRGLSRPTARCAIGAFEPQQATYTVGTNGDPVVPTSNPNFPLNASLPA